MNCPTCAHANRDSARFCEECGMRFAQSCASCGSDLRAGAKFCDNCGAPTGGPLPGEKAKPELAPRDYTPRHLVEKILQSKSALEGERKQVTVLFADVRGSMELSGQVDPEEWHAILDHFFQILADGVHRFEGTVNQYTGDGIMALFGAPIAHENHAHRACYAALQLREDLGRYTREVKRDRGLNFSVRIGINSGDVVVGKIGDDLRMDYTAQGHTVGLAARMQELASPDTVYLTRDTSGLVEGYFDLEDLGSFKLKGVSAPVSVFQLTGLGSLRTRMDVSRARGLTRFVGRDDDVRTLESALERCFEGNGSVVGVVAEPGVGKSRLCYEFLERCRARGLRTLEGQAVAHGKNVPFLPILQVFRAYFEIQDQDSDRVAREKIAGRLLLLDEAFRDALPLLFDFLGVPDPERPAPRMDPQSRQRRLFGVLRQLVRSARRESPVITLIEDLHWLDEGSESWVAEMVDAFGGSPGLLLVNFRPEYRAGWMQKSYYRQLPLSPLGREAIRELLDDLLGQDESVAGLAERIHERTAGNPFFTEEVIQSLIEGGNLEGTRGRYRLVTPVTELRIPRTVQSILAARIDRLLERAKQVLQTAAVIGREFSELILEGVVELPRADLVDALETLKGAEFIYEQSLYPVAEYAFKHPLTHEVALHSQLRDRRRRIHAEVARAIEAASPEKLDEQAALLAHHWDEAGEKLEAARWHRRAADWAGMSHASELIRHLRAVWDGLREVPETAETLRLRVEAVAMLLAWGLRGGLHAAEIEPLATEGQDLLGRSEDPRSRILFLRGHGSFLTYSKGPREGAALLGEAVRLADDLGEVDLRVGGRLLWMVLFVAMGPVRAGLEIAEEALELLRATPELTSDAMGYDTEVLLTAFHALSLSHAGRLADASREVECAVERAGQRDDAGALAVAHSMASKVAEAVGDAQASLAHATRAVELAEVLGTPNLTGLAYPQLGRALLLNEEWTRALEILKVGEEKARELIMLRSWADAPLSLALLRAGKEEEALAAAEAAVELSARIGADLVGSEHQLALARVLSETRGAPAREEIERAIDRAHSVARESGRVEHLPLVHLARAGLARVLRDEASRDRELREAHRLFVEMGATGHAERLERELALST
jgi:class 3 adenylate cyclase/tetratricopeptide (TPR) repeat protein